MTAKETAETGPPRGEAASSRVSAEDAELIARAKALQPEAWSAIYLRYEPLIARYIRARVADPTTSEDLTSSVFLAAVRSIGSLREIDRPLAWLYGIARNVVAQHQRSSARQRRWFEVFARRSASPDQDAAFDSPLEQALSSVPSRHGDPERLVERLDLIQAINRLTESQREVVLLRYVVGLTTTEVAAAMHRNPSAVYSLEARALAALRTQLQG